MIVTIGRSSCDKQTSTVFCANPRHHSACVEASETVETDAVRLESLCDFEELFASLLSQTAKELQAHDQVRDLPF